MTEAEVMNECLAWVAANKKSIAETGIPLCPLCSKPMKKAYDNIAKKKTGYVWDCKCNPKMQMCVG